MHYGHSMSTLGSVWPSAGVVAERLAALADEECGDASSSALTGRVPKVSAVTQTLAFRSCCYVQCCRVCVGICFCQGRIRSTRPHARASLYSISSAQSFLAALFLASNGLAPPLPSTSAFIAREARLNPAAEFNHAKLASARSRFAWCASARFMSARTLHASEVDARLVQLADLSDQVHAEIAAAHGA
jgi:hypothetical protein